MQRLTPVGRVALLGALAIALLGIFWPEPHGVPEDGTDQGPSSKCPLGYGGNGEANPHTTFSAASHQLTLFYNGTIWTGATEDEVVAALLVDNVQGSVVGAGGMEELRVMAERVGKRMKPHDLQGRFLMPGFVDPHVHLLHAGLFLSAANLAPATSQQQFQQILTDHVTTLERQETQQSAAGGGTGTDAGGGTGGGGSGVKQLQWVLGGQWDEGRWGGVLPDRTWLDAATGPDRPALLSRSDTHMAVANSAAMRLAGVTEHTPDPPGGVIDRDAAGRPTGVLRENAMGLVAGRVPAATREQLDQALQMASDYALSHGVTTVNCMGRSPFTGDMETTWQDLEQVLIPAADAGQLRLRVVAFTPLQSWQRMAAHVEAYGRAHERGRLFWGGVKAFADGSLGSRTALMWQPYSDTQQSEGEPPSSEEHGTRIISIEELYELTRGADAAGLNVAVHAIGDRAVDEVVGVFKRVRVDNAQAGVHGVSADAPGPQRVGTSSSGDAAGILLGGSSSGEAAGSQGSGEAGHAAAGGEAQDRAAAVGQAGTDAAASPEGSGWYDGTWSYPAGSIEDTPGCQGSCGGDGTCTLRVRGPRHRVEHMQHVSGPGSAVLASQLGVTATPNPLHLVADGEMMQRRLGAERAGPGRSYAFRTLHEAGVRLGMSSDWPVTDLHPLAGVFASVFRRDGLDPSQPAPSWGTEEQEALRPGQALRGHTAEAAYVGLLEDYVGTLRSGLRADFIVLSGSPLLMRPGQPLPDVLSTYVDGVCVYGCTSD